MQLIVDFPADRSRSRRRSVHFADTSVMCIAVVFDTISYDKSDYSRMENDNKKFILRFEQWLLLAFLSVTLETTARP